MSTTAAKPAATATKPEAATLPATPAESVKDQMMRIAGVNQKKTAKYDPKIGDYSKKDAEYSVIDKVGCDPGLILSEDEESDIVKFFTYAKETVIFRPNGTRIKFQNGYFFTNDPLDINFLRYCAEIKKMEIFEGNVPDYIRKRIERDGQYIVNEKGFHESARDRDYEE